jgi:hypothetical protein
LAISLALASCTQERPAENAAEPGVPESNPLRNAYFGDLHVHTSWSMDAFIFKVRVTPDDAYRYAKGEAIDHVSGEKIQLQSGPLDFMAVTDHAAYLGVLPAMADPNHPLSKDPVAKLWASDDPADRSGWVRLTNPPAGVSPSQELRRPDVTREAWGRTIEIANRHYQPGKFTAFIGFEYTSHVNYQNLHRNVIFRGERAPDLPFSAYDSANPEDLWDWLDGVRADGMEALAIPHNMNLSDGQMFKLTDYAGAPIDAAYADQRMRNEPLVEMTQIKGTSETHPALSPNDEWAAFEIKEDLIAHPQRKPGQASGSYVREAYRNGLEMEEESGFNPYRFGMIGASDSHNASTPVEENNFTGKIGVVDGNPEARLTRLPGPTYSAAGLAGVWAEQNTREAIFDAMKRKETWATSGPRIRLRVFAGWGFGAQDHAREDMVAHGYAEGVPMGGDLAPGPEGQAPKLMIWAVKDPHSAPLDRLQVIKLWVENGASQEKVIDVACSDGAAPDAAGRCPDNGATVDLTNCAISQDKGDAEIATTWQDPDFDAGERAMYYVRVLENPTCRWSTWDALRLGRPLLEDKPATIQERAFASPIWYRPR